MRARCHRWRCGAAMARLLECRQPTMNECVAGGRTLSSTCDSLNSLDLASAMLGVRVSARLGSLLVGTVPLCFSISASTLECVCAM